MIAIARVHIVSYANIPPARAPPLVATGSAGGAPGALVTGREARARPAARRTADVASLLLVRLEQVVSDELAPLEREAEQFELRRDVHLSCCGELWW